MSQSPQDRLEANRKRWDDFAPLRDKIYHEEYPDFWERLRNGENVWLTPTEVRLMGDICGSDCLVLGCGTDAWQALSLANLGGKVWATDVSAVSIEYARRNAKDLHINVSFEVADSQHLPMFGNHSFDIVYGMYLYYLEDLRQAFSEWFRVLRPSGKVILNLGDNPFMKIFSQRQDGSYVIKRSYFTRSWPDDPDTLWDGIKLGKKYGYKPLPGFRWHHTIGDFLNNLAAAGFVLNKFVEESHDAAGNLRLTPGLIIIRVDKIAGYRIGSVNKPVRQSQFSNAPG